MHLVSNARHLLIPLIITLVPLEMGGCSRSAGQAPGASEEAFHPHVPFAGADYREGAQKLYDATVSGQGGIKEVRVEQANVVLAKMSSGVMYFAFEGRATLTLTDGEKLECNFWEELDGNLPNGTRSMEHFGYDTVKTDSAYKDFQAWKQHLKEGPFLHSIALRHSLSIDQLMEDMGATPNPKYVQDWSKANDLSWPDRGEILP